jgi:hypothetical protein
MKISNIEFTDSEWAQIVKLAKAQADYQSSLTPPNILRLALSLETKQRGGKRDNAGRKAPLVTASAVSETGRRGGREA